MEAEQKQKLLEQLNDKSLRVFMFNVSQGDHLLLKLPNGEFGIIDFCYAPKLGQTAPPALDFLKKINHLFPKKEIKISFIYLSHPDHDHIMGMDKVFDWIKVKKIKVHYLWWFGGRDVKGYLDKVKELTKDIRKKEPDANTRKEELNPFLGKLEKIEEFIKNQKAINPDFKDAPIVELGLYCNLEEIKVFKKAPLSQQIEKFKIEKFGFLYVKHLTQLTVKDDKSDANFISSALLMVFKNFKLLFGGDVHKDAWLECFTHYDSMGFGDDDSYPEFNAHFIKASHHGSKNSSSEDIWKRLINVDSGKPIHIGFSSGIRWEHPHDESLNHINNVKPSSLNINLDATIDASYYQKKYDEESLDWVFAKKNDHPNSDVSFIKNRSLKDNNTSRKGDDFLQKVNDTSLNMRTGKLLSAYIYEFSPDSENITVTLGTTTKFVDIRGGKNNPDHRRRSILPLP